MVSSAGVAVVVGGTRGIGLATARRLARDGMDIAVLGRDAGSAARARQALQEAGSPQVLALSADAKARDSVVAAFDQIAAEWDQINVLVNAVGQTTLSEFEELDDDAWIEAFDIGALSAVRCIRAALPLLRAAEWARIVNVTAMSVQHQGPRLVSYTASKAALASITKNLSRSLAPEGIIVNAVAPGPVLTDWAGPLLEAAGIDPRDAVRAYTHLAPSFTMHVDLQRFGLPEEVAAVIAFCASRENSFMTGAHLNVDGGSDFS